MTLLLISVDALPQNRAATRGAVRRIELTSRAAVRTVCAGAGLATPAVHDGGSLAGNESSSVSSTRADIRWRRSDSRSFRVLELSVITLQNLF